MTAFRGRKNDNDFPSGCPRDTRAHTSTWQLPPRASECCCGAAGPAVTGTGCRWRRPTVSPALRALPEGGLLLPLPSPSARRGVKSLGTALGDESHDPTSDLVTSTGCHGASALYSSGDKPAPAALQPQQPPFHHLVTDALGDRRDPSPLSLGTYSSERTHA